MLFLFSLSHFECDSHTVHMLTQWHLPPPLTDRHEQWSHHCSCMGIPVHTPWLPCYISVMQTDLVLLTVAGVTPDSPRMFSFYYKQFLKFMYHFIFPSAIYESLVALQPHQHLVFSVFYSFKLLYWKWKGLVFILMSSVTSAVVRHYCVLAIHVISLVKCLFKCLLMFNILFLSFYYWFAGVFPTYTLNTTITYMY